MLQKVLIVTCCWLLSLDLISGTCYETNLVLKWVPQKFPKTFVQTYTTKCWFGRNCEKTKIGSYMYTRYVPRNVVEKKCCTGYVMVENDNFNASRQLSKASTYVDDWIGSNGSDPACCSDCFSLGPNLWFGAQSMCEKTHDIWTETSTSARVEFCYSVPAGRIECKPVCLPSCQNGDCVSPGSCRCKPGYREEDGNPRSCVPSCVSCVHGTCVAPDVCNCSFGYSLQNGTCQAICTEPCRNGTCVAPDTCECLYGFRKSESNICSPYCSRGCSNGTCTAPETCTCDKGWVNTSPDECVPFCERNCGNGICSAPNKCQCELGYKVEENNTPACVPICDTECGNGTCIGPNVCKCVLGYKLNGHNAPMCVPNCDTDCGNGTCVGPNLCECSSGYKLDIQSSPRCVPNCDNKCGNGTCIAPNVCECKEGFKMGNGKATICVPDCGNCEGVCEEPGKCLCKEPFKVKRLTIDERECDDNIKNCTTICAIDATVSTYVKNVSYGYDDFLTNDTTPLQSIAKDERETSSDSLEYSDYYGDDSIDNDTSRQHSPVEINVANTSERWMHSKWAYAALSVGVVIVAIVLGSIAIYWKTLSNLCCGSGSYPVEEDPNKDATEQDQGNEMRMTSILKKRQADPS